MKAKNEVTDYSVLVPKTIVEFEQNEDKITLLYPKFKNKFLLKLFPNLSKLFFKISLDRIGSFVWLQIDGIKAVAEISSITEKHFNEEDSIKDRVIKFVMQMSSYKFIIFFKIEEN